LWRFLVYRGAICSFRGRAPASPCSVPPLFARAARRAVRLRSRGRRVGSGCWRLRGCLCIPARRGFARPLAVFLGVALRVGRARRAAGSSCRCHRLAGLVAAGLPLVCGCVPAPAGCLHAAPLLGVAGVRPGRSVAGGRPGFIPVAGALSSSVLRVHTPLGAPASRFVAAAPVGAVGCSAGRSRGGAGAGGCGSPSAVARHWRGGSSRLGRGLCPSAFRVGTGGCPAPGACVLHGCVHRAIARGWSYVLICQHVAGSRRASCTCTSSRCWFHRRSIGGAGLPGVACPGPRGVALGRVAWRVEGRSRCVGAVRPRGRCAPCASALPAARVRAAAFRSPGPVLGSVSSLRVPGSVSRCAPPRAPGALPAPRRPYGVRSPRLSASLRRSPAPAGPRRGGGWWQPPRPHCSPRRLAAPEAPAPLGGSTVPTRPRSCRPPAARTPAPLVRPRTRRLRRGCRCGGAVLPAGQGAVLPLCFRSARVPARVFRLFASVSAARCRRTLSSCAAGPRVRSRPSSAGSAHAAPPRTPRSRLVAWRPAPLAASEAPTARAWGSARCSAAPIRGVVLPPALRPRRPLGPPPRRPARCRSGRRVPPLQPTARARPRRRARPAFPVFPARPVAAHRLAAPVAPRPTDCALCLRVRAPSLSPPPHAGVPVLRRLSPTCAGRSLPHTLPPSCATHVPARPARHPRRPLLCGPRAAPGLLAPSLGCAGAGCSRRGFFPLGWPLVASIPVFQGLSPPCARAQFQCPSVHPPGRALSLPSSARGAHRLVARCARAPVRIHPPDSRPGAGGPRPGLAHVLAGSGPVGDGADQIRHPFRPRLSPPGPSAARVCAAPHFPWSLAWPAHSVIRPVVAHSGSRVLSRGRLGPRRTLPRPSSWALPR